MLTGKSSGYAKFSKSGHCTIYCWENRPDTPHFQNSNIARCTTRRYVCWWDQHNAYHIAATDQHTRVRHRFLNIRGLSGYAKLTKPGHRVLPILENCPATPNWQNLVIALTQKVQHLTITDVNRASRQLAQDWRKPPPVIVRLIQTLPVSTCLTQITTMWREIGANTAS